MRELRRAHALVVITTTWEDGDDLMPSGITLGDGNGGPQVVPLSDLRGSKFYDSIEAAWPTLKAQAEEADQATTPPEARRRAKSNGKVSA